jgi:hypothetical protein
MTPKTLTGFRLDADLIAGLKAVKERDGILLAEQVRRAIVAWLDAKGISHPLCPARAKTRKR